MSNKNAKLILNKTDLTTIKGLGVLCSSKKINYLKMSRMLSGRDKNKSPYIYVTESIRPVLGKFSDTKGNGFIIYKIFITNEGFKAIVKMDDNREFLIDETTLFKYYPKEKISKDYYYLFSEYI